MENFFETIVVKLSKIETDIAELKRQGQGKSFSEPMDDIISLVEAVKLLNLAKPTIYALTSKNEIPFIKKSRKLYFSKKDLLKWINEGRKSTVSEANEKANQYLLRKANR